MEEKGLISIIIPIYNTEKYLKKCFESVLNQSYQYYEIIAVNDGSTDSSLKICIDFAKKNSKIKVISQENRGSSAARNAGINHSSGEFIIFLDSDDYWDDPDALKKLHEKIENNPNADILLFGCKEYYQNKNKIIVKNNAYDKNYFFNSKKEDIIKYLFNKNLFPGSAWILMTRSKLIKQNNVYFIEGIIAEDIDWLINLFQHANNIDALNFPFYIYNKNRPGSITSTATLKGMKSIFFTIDKWYQTLTSQQTIESEYFLDFLAFHYVTSVLGFAFLVKEDQKIIFPELVKRKFILKYAKRNKVKLCALLINILGINFSAFLLKIYRSL